MIAAVDIGGTKTLVAIFDDHGIMAEKKKFPTNPDYKLFKRELADVVAKLSTKDFEFGVAGIRGNIDRKTGSSTYDDELRWGHVSIVDACAKIFGCDFLLENDTKLAGLSEAVLLTDDFNKVVYLTISTGVGSAFIVNGKLDQNTIDSEVGKSLYEHEGLIQKWEDFASGKAIVAKYHKRASDISDPAIWEEISRNIAIGLINVIAAFQPQVVVFGGGVGSNFDKFIKPLKKIMLEIKPKAIAMPVLRVAQRPEEAVVYGCYELAKQSHEKSTH